MIYIPSGNWRKSACFFSKINEAYDPRFSPTKNLCRSHALIFFWGGGFRVQAYDLHFCLAVQRVFFLSLLLVLLCVCVCVCVCVRVFVVLFVLFLFLVGGFGLGFGRFPRSNLNNLTLPFVVVFCLFFVFLFWFLFLLLWLQQSQKKSPNDVDHKLTYVDHKPQT